MSSSRCNKEDAQTAALPLGENKAGDGEPSLPFVIPSFPAQSSSETNYKQLLNWDFFLSVLAYWGVIILPDMKVAVGVPESSH